MGITTVATIGIATIVENFENTLIVKGPLPPLSTADILCDGSPNIGNQEIKHELEEKNILLPGQVMADLRNQVAAGVKARNAK